MCGCLANVVITNPKVVMIEPKIVDFEFIGDIRIIMIIVFLYIALNYWIFIKTQ